MLKSGDSQLISMMRTSICVQKKIPSMPSSPTSHIKLLYTAFSFTPYLLYQGVASLDRFTGTASVGIALNPVNVAVDIFAEDDDSGDNIVSSQEQLDS